MNETEEHEDPEQPGYEPGKPLPSMPSQSNRSPYDRSLFGQFARLALILTSTGLLAWCAWTFFSNQNSFILPIASVVLLVALFYSGGPKILRIGILALMAINILSIVVNADYAIAMGSEKVSQIPNYVLLACLTIAISFEITAWFTHFSLTKTAFWGFVVIPAAIYIIGIPAFELLQDSAVADEKKLALKDPDWKFWNEAAFRACEFVVFGLFAYLGACLGSFLNVVAYCVPRNEAISFRDSSCPQCNTKISRIDNLPIFSYINLSAKCRNCSGKISPRYLIVELIVATIFGSLFLFELIIGGKNVPSINSYHEGVLWVILYPKWPLIAIYCFHAIYMSSLLVLAIFEWDRQPLKRMFAALVGGLLFLAPLVYWPIQPVPLLDHISLLIQMPPWLNQFLRLLVGGIVGLGFGYTLGFVDKSCRSPNFRFAMALTGVVLGWQTLVQVTLIFILANIALRFLPKQKSTPFRIPTSLLLLVVLVHHPFWKTISQWWD